MIEGRVEVLQIHHSFIHIWFGCVEPWVTNFMQTFLTVISTVVSGTLVLIIGQIIQNFVLKPLQDFKVIKGEISHKVKFHLNIITNSGFKPKYLQKINEDMRDLSSNLESKYILIPLVDFWAIFNIVPKRNNVREAAMILIQLSNAGGRSSWELKNYEAAEKLKKLLNLVL